MNGQNRAFLADLAANPLGVNRTNYTLKGDLSAVVGTGTTDPSPTDYCLENDVTSSISNFSSPPLIS